MGYMVCMRCHENTARDDIGLCRWCRESVTTITVTEPRLGAITKHVEYRDMSSALRKWVPAFYAPCRQDNGVEMTLAESGAYAAEWATEIENSEAM